jgi:hypothetical protein|tara:strand:- start:52 stop:741 length:690 start_codon:yes stop_codon:yes gene_type:complete
MKKYLLFLAVFSLLLFTTSRADEVVSFQYNDDNLLLPLPVSFCDATEELVGIFAMDYMKKQLSAEGMEIAPEPITVFTRCGYENNLEEMYPWGYIGLMKNSKPHLTQNAYNKMLNTVLGNSKFMQKLEEIAGEATELTLSEYGLDINFNSGIGESIVVWTDENVVVLTSANQYILDGELIIENLVGASSALNKTIVHYYIMDIENGVTTPIENVSLLIDNSKRLVRMNK